MFKWTTYSKKNADFFVFLRKKKFNLDTKVFFFFFRDLYGGLSHISIRIKYQKYI